MIGASSTTEEGTGRKGRPFEKGNQVGKATQFKVGNASQLQHGAYSAMIRARDRQRDTELQKAGIQRALVEDTQEITDDLARRQSFPATPIQARQARRYAELDGMAAFLFSKLMDGDGPLTATGKTKRAFAHYLAVVGTQSKIASALGLPKPSAAPQSRGSVLPHMSQYVAPDAGDDAS